MHFDRGTPDRAESLTDVLRQSEHVTDLIKRAGEDLASINARTEPGPANSGLRHEMLLEDGAALQAKLQDALEQLTAVNRALAIEARERTMVDRQLAAAVEQEGGARHAAFHDSLSGLPNRALFNDRLEHGIAQATRHEWILGVMYLDVDKFKSINDTYGHDAGDAVLRAIALRLTENTRAEDTVSRHGGDEFLCLLTQIHGEDDIAMIAAEILKAIQAPCNVNAHDLNLELSLEASIGISMFPRDGVTAAALIKNADDAMYRAKLTKAGFAFAQSGGHATRVRLRTDT